jgi:hypothetical protein
MALVKCRECGSQISDSAATCPHCGVSAPAGAASLTFVRPKFTGSAVRIEIFVDGQPFGNIRYKGRVAVPVTPGRHHIELQSSQGKSAVGTIDVSPGDKVLTVTMSAFGAPRFQ